MTEKSKEQMKCFRIDDGDEYFYYAAPSEGLALLAYIEDCNADYDAEGAEVREVAYEDMPLLKVSVEDEDQFPGGAATLKDVFEFATSGTSDVTIQLCGSVY